MKDVTFVIQGPANSISISSIDNLLKFGKVVISCYDTDNLEKYSIPSEVKVIRNPPATHHPMWHPSKNIQNSFFQAYTTLSGLNHVDTEFAIKMRGDESFECFSSFIEKMKQFPEKYTTINFLFRKDSHFKFHPSDHLFGCKTSILRDAFNILFYKNVEIQNAPIECKIFLSFLQAKGIVAELNRSKEQMTQNCQIVNLREMKEFILSVNCGNDYKSPIKYNSSQIDHIESHESHITVNRMEEI